MKERIRVFFFEFRFLKVDCSISNSVTLPIDSIEYLDLFKAKSVQVQFLMYNCFKFPNIIRFI